MIKTYYIDKRVIFEGIAKILTAFPKYCQIAILVHNFGTTKNREPARFYQDRPGTINGTETRTGSPLDLIQH